MGQLRQSFGENEIEVELEGEAVIIVFDVTSNAYMIARKGRRRIL